MVEKQNGGTCKEKKGYNCVNLFFNIYGIFTDIKFVDNHRRNMRCFNRTKMGMFGP